MKSNKLQPFRVLSVGDRKYTNDEVLSCVPVQNLKNSNNIFDTFVSTNFVHKYGLGKWHMARTGAHGSFPGPPLEGSPAPQRTPEHPGRPRPTLLRLFPAHSVAFGAGGDCF